MKWNERNGLYGGSRALEDLGVIATFDRASSFSFGVLG